MSAFLLAKEGLRQESEAFISIWNSLGTAGVLNIMSCSLKTWKMTKVMFRRTQSRNINQLYFGMCKVTVLVSSRCSNLRPGLRVFPSTHSPSFSFDFYFVSLFSTRIMPNPKNNPVTFLSCADVLLRPSCSKIGSGLGFPQCRKIEVYTLDFFMEEREAKC